MTPGTDVVSIESRLLSIAPDAMLVVDQTGRIKQVNLLAEQIFGYPAGSLAGQPLAVLIPERLRDEHQRRVTEYLRDPRPRPMGVGLILSGLRRDHSEFAAEISLNPLATADGIHILVAVRDVSGYRRALEALEQATVELERQVEIRNAELVRTNAVLPQQFVERAQIEAALRETETLYRQLVEKQPDLICRFLPDTTLTFVNTAYARFFDRQPEELVGQRFIEFLCVEDRAEIWEQLAAFTSAAPARQYEHKMIRADGVVRWHLWNDFAFFDDQSNITGFQSVGVDITGRKRVEEALCISEERLTLALRAANAGAWEWNAATNQAIWSDDNYRVLGLAPGSVESSYENWLRCVHPDDRAEAERQVAQAMVQGDDLNIEFRVVWPDGGIHWVNDIGKMQFDLAGKPVGMSGIQMDITERKRAEEALRGSEALLAKTTADAPAMIYQFLLRPDGTSCFPYASARCWEIFGVPPETLLESAAPLLDRILPDDRPGFEESVACSARTLEPWRHEFRLRSARGDIVWHQGISRPERQADGSILWSGVFFDTTERKQAEEALFEEKERAQVTLHSIGDAVITADGHAIVDYLNPVAEALTGWTTAEAHGRSLSEVFHIVNEQTRQPALDPVVRCLQEGKIVGLANHTVLIGRHGQEYHIDDSAAPIRGRDGRVLGVVLVFHDVTENRQLTQQLEYDATHDALTGLINRTEFERRLARALASAQQYGARHALCYLDLDQFKVVNDTAGHAAGDELLRQINTILSGMFRERDSLARIGGDEFGLLLDNCPLDRAQLIAQTVVGNIRDHRFHWEGRTYQIGVSIGLTPITAEAQDTAQLLTQADVACYIAKEMGRNRVHIYQREDTETVQRHGEILGAAGLRDSLEQGRFRLHYQPIVPLDAPDPPRPSRYEALLRVVYKGSPDANTELVLPAAFIPAAERYGLMGAIDRWVIQTAFAEYAKGISRTGAQIAINLSGNSLSDESLLGFIEAQFAAHAFPPDRVCFEITETAAIQNLRPALELMAALKRRGSQLALDDFGSGLSSFRYLKTLPVDYLKIDGSFIKDMVGNPNDCALVAAINQMSHALGIQTIAEYAESQAIVERLRELGVDYAQGFFFGHAAPWGQQS